MPPAACHTEHGPEKRPERDGHGDERVNATCPVSESFTLVQRKRTPNRDDGRRERGRTSRSHPAPCPVTFASARRYGSAGTRTAAASTP